MFNNEVHGTLPPAAAPFTEAHTYGLPVLTSNCSNNYGPYHFPEKLFPLLLLNALAGKPLPLYGDGGLRDWLYVKDHCAVLRCILTAGQPGETYNVGGRSELPNLEVAHRLCDLLDTLHLRADGQPYRDTSTPPLEAHEAEKRDKVNESAKSGYDAKPVTHWGSDVGCIRSAGLYRNGVRDDVIDLGDEIEIRVAFKVPPRADRNYLSIAFAIKDLKGSDLIVSSTHDWERMPLKGHGGVYLARFRNPLVTRKYLLVAAIEDHSSSAIHYYEYLEGAQYFSSMADAHLFGLFQPEIHQEMVEIYE